MIRKEQSLLGNASSIEQPYPYLEDIMAVGEQGSTEFRHYFVAGPNKIIDVTDDGDLSCAWFVSSVLWKHALLRRAHPTVFSTVKALEKHPQWEEVDPDTTTPGSVIMWPLSEWGNCHLGFYLGQNERGDDEYVSNSFMKKSPIIHGRELIDGRQPVRAFSLTMLNASSSTLQDHRGAK